jgi:hypothetical protein
MVKPAIRKSRVTGRSSLASTAKASSTEPKWLVNDVLGRANPPISRKSTTDPITFGSLMVDTTHKPQPPLTADPAGAARADSLGEPILSADMEPDKLPTDCRTAIADNKELEVSATVASNMIVEATARPLPLTSSLKRDSKTIIAGPQSTAKAVNERGATGSPPDKKHREQQLSLVSPAEEEVEDADNLSHQVLLTMTVEPDTTVSPTDGKPAATTTSAHLPSTLDPPTYAKAVVGFLMHDEEQVDGVNPDGMAKTRKKLARVFTTALSRNHTLFIKIMFPTTASKSDPTKLLMRR